MDAKTTSILLQPGQVEKLRRMAAAFGFLQSRGSGANRDGSISQLMQAIAHDQIVTMSLSDEQRTVMTAFLRQVATDHSDMLVAEGAGAIAEALGKGE